MKPMNLPKALLFFCIPGLLIFLLFTLIYRDFTDGGIPVFWAAYICIWGPLLVLLAGVLALFKKAGVKADDYFWTSRLTGKQVLIAIGAFVAVQTAEYLLGFTRPLLSSLPGFHVPEFYPDIFRVDTELRIPLGSFMGMTLSNNPMPLVLFGFWLVTNIGCEEILWRGYALPRMEMVFGSRAWLVNGLLWNLGVHFFFRYSYITLLPVSLAVPYLSQRYRSLWPGVIIHGLGNLLVYVLLVPGYLG